MLRLVLNIRQSARSPGAPAPIRGLFSVSAWQKETRERLDDRRGQSAQPRIEKVIIGLGCLAGRAAFHMRVERRLIGRGEVFVPQSQLFGPGNAGRLVRHEAHLSPRAGTRWSFISR